MRIMRIRISYLLFLAFLLSCFLLLPQKVSIKLGHNLYYIGTGCAYGGL